MALPKENEQQLFFYYKYKWLSIILINYCYYIKIRICDRDWTAWWWASCPFPSFKYSCFLSEQKHAWRLSSPNTFGIPLLQEINLLMTRTFFPHIFSQPHILEWTLVFFISPPPKWWFSYIDFCILSLTPKHASRYFLSIFD